jgi:hypothetical protein
VYHNLQLQNSCTVMYPRNMTCFRCIMVNTRHKGNTFLSESRCALMLRNVDVQCLYRRSWTSLPTPMKFTATFRTHCLMIMMMILIIISRDSAVGTATVVQAGRSVVLIPLRLRFFSYPKRPDQQWGPPEPKCS